MRIRRTKYRCLPKCLVSNKLICELYAWAREKTVFNDHPFQLFILSFFNEIQIFIELKLSCAGTYLYVYCIVSITLTLSSRVRAHTWPHIYNYVSPYLSDNGQGIAIRRDRRCFNILVLCVFVYMRACPCDWWAINRSYFYHTYCFDFLSTIAGWNKNFFINAVTLGVPTCKYG